MAGRVGRTRGGGGSERAGLTSGRPRPRAAPPPQGPREAAGAERGPPRSRPSRESPTPIPRVALTGRFSSFSPKFSPLGVAGGPGSSLSRDPPRCTSDTSLEGTPTDPPESSRSPPSPPAVRKPSREATRVISTSAPDPVLRLKNLPQRTPVWSQIPYPPSPSRNIPPGPLLIFQ